MKVWEWLIGIPHINWAFFLPSGILSRSISLCVFLVVSFVTVKEKLVIFPSVFLWHFTTYF